MIFVQYPVFEYYLLPFKVIEFILFLILTFKMIKLKKNLLNYIFAAAFISWLLYLVGDIYNNILAAESPIAFNIAVILRDIMITGAMFTSFFLFLATNIILKSEKVLSKQFILISLLLYILFIIIVIFNDSIWIENDGLNFPPEELPPVGGLTKVREVLFPIAIIISAIPTLIYVYSAIALLRLTKQSTTTGDLKKRMYYLSVGIVFIAIGMIYYIILSSLNELPFIFSPIGHIFWMLSPILIWKSQIRKE